MTTETANPVCSVERCGRQKNGKEFCNLHRGRQRRGTPLDAPIRLIKRIPECQVEGCVREHEAKGYCTVHYVRSKRGWDLSVPIRKRMTRSNEAKRIHGGYVDMKVGPRSSSDKDGWMPEHRYVMEQHLGRALLEHETVHHLNGQRDDNRIENLELWSKSQPYGQRVVDKLEWCRWFMAQYEGTTLPMEMLAE